MNSKFGDPPPGGNPNFLIGQIGYCNKEPGAYKLVVTCSTRMIKPGQTLIVRIAISGYGLIGYGPKLVFAPSHEFVESGEAYAGFEVKENGKIGWGAKQGTFSGRGGIFQLTSTIGLPENEDIRVSQFLDSHLTRGFGVNKHPTAVQIISTETFYSDGSANIAPVELHIRTKKNSKYGNYDLNFLLTYYNGESWQVDSAKSEIRILSVVERNAFKLAALGIALTIAGLTVRFI